MEEVRLREVAYNTRNMSTHIGSIVNMEPRAFGIGSLGVGIPEHSILVVIPPGV
jgi:hypothetical protein